MKLQPRKYKSELLHPVLTVECRQDRLGNIFYLVDFVRDGIPFSFAFEYLSSAIDFINSNFNRHYDQRHEK